MSACLQSWRRQSLKSVRKKGTTTFTDIKYPMICVTRGQRTAIIIGDVLVLWQSAHGGSACWLSYLPMTGIANTPSKIKIHIEIEFLPFLLFFLLTTPWNMDGSEMDGYLFPLPTLEVCLGSREDRSGGSHTRFSKETTIYKHLVPQT